MKGRKFVEIVNMEEENNHNFVLLANQSIKEENVLLIHVWKLNYLLKMIARLAVIVKRILMDSAKETIFI